MKQFHIQIDNELMVALLEKEAKERCQSTTAYIRFLLIQHCKREFTSKGVQSVQTTQSK